MWGGSPILLLCKLSVCTRLYFRYQFVSELNEQSHVYNSSAAAITLYHSSLN